MSYIAAVSFSMPVPGRSSPVLGRVYSETDFLIGHRAAEKAAMGLVWNLYAALSHTPSKDPALVVAFSNSARNGGLDIYACPGKKPRKGSVEAGIVRAEISHFGRCKDAAAFWRDLPPELDRRIPILHFYKYAVYAP